jgi:hypothetical protein
VACIDAVTAALAARPHDITLYVLLDDLYQLDPLAPAEERIRELAARLVESFASQPEIAVRAARDFAAQRRLLEARTILAGIRPRLAGPDRWDVTLELAALEQRARQNARALALASELDAADVAPAVTAAARELAARITLEDLSQPVEARRIVEGLVARFPESQRLPHWRHLLARCAMGQLALSDAARLLAALEPLADAQLLPAILLDQARLALIAGQIDAAREKLDLLVSRFPAHPHATDALADLLFLGTHREEGKPVLVPEYFRQRHAVAAGRLDEYDSRVAAVDPSRLPPAFRSDFRLLSARALRARGRPDRALAAIDSLRGGGADSPVLEEALLLAAAIHEDDLKDQAAADRVREDFLMLFPSSVRAEDVRRRLERSGPPALSTTGGEPPAQ